MGAPAIHRYATATPEAWEAGKKTHKNADGSNATFIEDQGRVNYNSRGARVEISDDFPIIVFDRASPEDPGTESFRIENGEVIKPDGSHRPLKPLETFPLPDGGKMTVETTFPEGGDPVSKVTITNTERNGRNHAIDKRDWNNDFGLQVANVGGRGPLDVTTGSGRKLDGAAEDGEVNDSNLGLGFLPAAAWQGVAINKGGPDVPPDPPPPDEPPIDHGGPPPDVPDDGQNFFQSFASETKRLAHKTKQNLKKWFTRDKPDPGPPPPPTPAQREASRAKAQAEADAEYARLLAGSDSKFIQKYGHSKFMPNPPDNPSISRDVTRARDIARAGAQSGSQDLSYTEFFQKYGLPKPPQNWGKTYLELVHYAKTGEFLSPQEIANQAVYLSPEQFKDRYGYDKGLMTPPVSATTSQVPPLTLSQGDGRLVLTAPPAPTVDQVNEQVKQLFGGLPLYPNGRPTLNDVQQLQIGDCWLMSTLASLAKTQPDLIENNITFDPASQTFQVTLYDRPLDATATSGGPGVPYKVTVSVADVQNILNTRQGSKQIDPTAIWPSVYEAALARVGVDTNASPSISNITGSKMSGDAGLDTYFALTGAQGTSLRTSAEAIDQLERALAEGRSATLGTYPDWDPAKSPLQRGPDGLTDNHEYTVIGIERHQAPVESVVVLRDPRYHTDTEDGYIRIPFSQLINTLDADGYPSSVITISAPPVSHSTLSPTNSTFFGADAAVLSNPWGGSGVGTVIATNEFFRIQTGPGASDYVRVTRDGLLYFGEETEPHQLTQPLSLQLPNGNTVIIGGVTEQVPATDANGNPLHDLNGNPILLPRFKPQSLVETIPGRDALMITGLNSASGVEAAPFKLW